MKLRTWLLGGVMALSIVASRAENWPQFRGPHGDGVSGESLWSEWRLLWKVPLSGPGHSSPIVWGDYVFLTAFEPESSFFAALLGRRGRLLVLCHDRSTGEQRWAREVAADEIEKVTSINQPASPTPATDGSRVFVYFGSVGLLAFDFDGNLLWEHAIGPYKHHMGTGSSPIVVGNRVVLNVETDGPSFLLAVDKDTGRKVWQVPRRIRQAGYSTPFVWEDRIVLAGHRSITAYRLDNGLEVWTLRGLSDYVVPTPVAGADALYATSAGPGGNVIVAVTADGKERWRSSRGAAYVASPAVASNRLFTVSKNCVISSLDSADGTMIWQQRLGQADGCYASPVIVGNKIHVVSVSGRLSVLSVEDDGLVAQTIELEERVLASPAVSGGTLLVRSNEGLFAFVAGN